MNVLQYTFYFYYREAIFILQSLRRIFNHLPFVKRTFQNLSNYKSCILVYYSFISYLTSFDYLQNIKSRILIESYCSFRQIRVNSWTIATFTAMADHHLGYSIAFYIMNSLFIFSLNFCYILCSYWEIFLFNLFLTSYKSIKPDIHIIRLQCIIYWFGSEQVTRRFVTVIYFDISCFPALLYVRQFAKIVHKIPLTDTIFVTNANHYVIQPTTIKSLRCVLIKLHTLPLICSFSYKNYISSCCPKYQCIRRLVFLLNSEF